MATTAKKPTATRKPAAKATERKTPERARNGTVKQDNSHWGTAAIVGGVAAAGAIATAALFALRGSTVLSDMEDMLLDRSETAYQADGCDSSASFDAGIADEGTIPV